MAPMIPELAPENMLTGSDCNEVAAGSEACDKERVR